MPGGTDLWYENKFIHHRVKNMLRRGWLLKTYNDGKLLKGRLKTGEKIENDNLDILSPVGFVSHVAPGDKVEAFTMDVGGDPTRRVIMSIIGDREEHPVPDENESFFFTPGDKKMFVRLKKERNAQERSNDNSGRTKESGRVAGMHLEGKDQDTTWTTEATNAVNADKGMARATQGNFTVQAGSNTQFEAAKHIRKGETHREGKMYIEGVIHAQDVYAGGGTTISSSSGRFGGGLLQNLMGSWSAQGKEGQTSLLGVAQTLMQLLGNFNLFQGSQQQKNEQTDQKMQEVEQRVDNIEQRDLEDLDGRVRRIEQHLGLT